MICRLLNREFRYVFRSALRYLDQSVSSAMGCFVACFRVRDDRSSLSHSINPRQTVSERAWILSFFLVDFC